MINEPNCPICVKPVKVVQKSKTMRQFKLIFRYNFNPTYQPTVEEVEVEGQKWGQWIGSLSQNGQFVGTNQLGYSGKVLKSDGSFSNNMYMNGSEVLAGDMIINAHDFNEALSLAKGSPILDIGGNVEIRDLIFM